MRPVRLGPLTTSRCRRRTHLDHDPDADRDRRRPPNPGLKLRYETLATHRRAIRDLLDGHRLSEGGASGTDGAVARSVAQGSISDGVGADNWTPDSLDRPPLIWMARLTTNTQTATPEVLLKAADGGYLPVLIKGHRTTDPGHGAALTTLDRPLTNPASDISSYAISRRKKMRSHHDDALALAHIYRMLQELGLASAEERGGIIGYGGPAADPEWNDAAVIAWHTLGPDGSGQSTLADYDTRFADRLAVATAAATRAPALAQPSKIAECQRCPWWPVCGPELAAAHNISLLARGTDVDVLRNMGITTYDDVAALDPSAVAALPLTSIPASEARIRARAMVSNVPMVRRGEIVDPVRADVELDVDMESFGDDGAYLWGTYLTGIEVGDLRQGYRPFATWDSLDSPSAGINFVNFWQYLTALRKICSAAGYSFAAYCYSHTAEERWLYGTPARFGDIPGMPTHAEVAAFCRSPQWVDLYLEVKRCFVVPGSMRLKSVAPVAGFSWRDPEPGGENSMAWYRIATGTGSADADGGTSGKDAPGRDAPSTDTVIAHRERILRYNEDDVRATLALRHWMSEHFRTVPTAAELDAADFDTADFDTADFVAGSLDQRRAGN